MNSPWLSALHVYPVKSVQGLAPGAAAVEPWGLAGDRRWMLVDAGGKAVTQRERPRMALAAARPRDDGGVTLTAPGMPPLTVAVPRGHRTVEVRLFGKPVEAVPAAPEATAWFAAFLGEGEEVRLTHMDDPALRRAVAPDDGGRPGEPVSFADGLPLLLTTTASLDALNSLIAAGDHPAEGPLPMNRFRPNVVISGTPPWAEDGWRRVRIGEAVFRVAKLCARCVVTTTDQATGERGREPLRTLAAHRNVGGGLMFGQNLIPETCGTLRVGDTFTVME